MTLHVISLLIFGLTLAGFSRRVWWFTVADFFRLQYAVVAFVLLFISLWNADYIFACLNSICFTINIIRIRKFLPTFKRLDTHHDKQIVSINAYDNNLDLDCLNKVLGETDPALLLIMEMTDETEAVLKPRLNRYAYTLETPVRDGFRICLFSQHALTNQKITCHGPHDTPLLQADVMLSGKKFHIFSAHPKPPLNKQWYQERGDYFHEITPIFQKTKLPIIMLGDFNSVPWENHFARFLRETKLKSCLEGYGYRVTWPVFVPFMGVPMDHILVSQSVQYTSLSVGPYAGSDHYPISINLKQ